MGTYSDEDPNAGVGERVVSSIKKVGKQLVGARSTPPMGAANAANADAMAAAGQHPDEYLARARAGQSTDRDNQ